MVRNEVLWQSLAILSQRRGCVVRNEEIISLFWRGCVRTICELYSTLDLMEWSTLTGMIAEYRWINGAFVYCSGAYDALRG